MLSRCFRAEESRALYWTQQAVELCSDIEDESLNALVEPVLAAQAALARDRRIIVVGGKGCGKSSLLAALAGYPAIATVPMADQYICWRYVCRDGDATASRFIPVEQLDGLELVDTGDCAEPEVAAVVSKLLKGADVVIAVMDARTAETSPAWALLAELPEKRRSACLIAVTHTEGTSAEASLALKDRLREVCRERVSVPLPLYFVSPRAGADVPESFVQCVQEALAEPCGVRAAIRHLLECGKELARRQNSVLVARSHVASSDSDFLAGIEQEIDYFLLRQRGSVKDCVDGYSEAAMRALPDTRDALRRALGWIFSPVALLRLEQFGVGTEKFLYRCIRREILTQQESADANFTLSCMKHWQSVRPRMKKTLECDIGEFPEQELAKDLEELRVRMGRALYAPFTQLKMRSQYAKVFGHHVGWMATGSVLLCLWLVFAGILGILGFDFFAFLLLGLAAFTWVVGTLVHLLACRSICREVVLHSISLHEQLVAGIGEEIEALLVSRVAAYRRLYTAPREKVARQEAMLKPLEQRQKDINMQLNAAAPRL